MYTSKTNHFFQLVFRVMILPLELQLFWKLAFPQVRKSTVYFQVYMLSGTQDKTTPPFPLRQLFGIFGMSICIQHCNSCPLPTLSCDS